MALHTFQYHFYVKNANQSPQILPKLFDNVIFYIRYARHYNPRFVHFYPLFEGKKRLFKELFKENSAFMYGQYCQFGCGILKMVGPKKQVFWPKINILKGNHCILRIRRAPVFQKLGMILENKVVQKLNVFFYKKWSPKLIF